MAASVGVRGLTSQPWGSSPFGPVHRYVLSNGDVEIGVLSYGGILQSLRVPDREGRPGDVVLGFDDLESYLRHSPYFGAVVGRFANRIAGARFRLNDREYLLDANDGPCSLHGGLEGFDKRIWQVQEVAEGDAVGVRLQLRSPDGDQGFPAAVRVVMTYLLDPRNTLHLRYEVTNEEPPGGLATVVNPTNHAYFNLEGQGCGDVGDHVLQVLASTYTPVDADLVPTGELAPVEGSVMDFRTPRRIGEYLRVASPQLLAGWGYDHNWVLDERTPQVATLAARLSAPRTGRVLEVLTDQPGIQVYTGNRLAGNVRGKAGRVYRQGDAVTLETQHYPDSPNQPHFPSTVLPAGQVFRSVTTLRFGVE